MQHDYPYESRSGRQGTPEGHGDYRHVGNLPEGLEGVLEEATSQGSKLSSKGSHGQVLSF